MDIQPFLREIQISVTVVNEALPLINTFCCFGCPVISSENAAVQLTVEMLQNIHETIWSRSYVVRLK